MRPRQALDIYLSDYIDRPGGIDNLLPVFQQVRDRFGSRRALYPGSYLHITPSLVFPQVCYLDSLKDIAAALADPALLEYVNRHKSYPEKAEIRCYPEDYCGFTGEPEASFDLLISLNAGFISQAAKRFLRPGGLLLVNDGHYDARRAWVDPDYQLRGVFRGESLQLETAPEQLAACFQTNRGRPLTLEMVEADAQRSPSKASFRPAEEAAAYLFRKGQAPNGPT